MLARVLAGLLSLTIGSAGAMIESVTEPDVVVVAEADCEEAVTRAEMEEAAKVIDKRLDLSDIDDVKINITEDNKLEFESYDAENKDGIINAITAWGDLKFTDADGNTVLDVSHIEYVEVCFGPIAWGGNSEYYVQLYFTEAGREAMRVATENAVKLIAENKNYISIVVDGEEYSKPIVTEVIDAENCIVSGSFTKESANELALVINGGQMPFKLKVVQ